MELIRIVGDVGRKEKELLTKVGRRERERERVFGHVGRRERERVLTKWRVERVIDNVESRESY